VNKNLNPDQLRYGNDKSMFDSLLQEREVQKVNDWIKKREEEGPQGVRRQLLSTSVRLSEGLAPSIHKMALSCAERLEMDIPMELYVYSRKKGACLLCSHQVFLKVSLRVSCVSLWVMSSAITFMHIMIYR